MRSAAIWGGKTTRSQQSYDHNGDDKLTSRNFGHVFEPEELSPRNVGQARLLVRGTPGQMVELIEWTEFVKYLDELRGEPKHGPHSVHARAARRSSESEGPGPWVGGKSGPSRPEVRVPGHLRRYRTPIGAPCTNFAVRQRLSRAVDRDFKGCADGAHLGVGKPAKPADQYATETLSTESRFTAERRGIGSEPGSSTTSLASPRIVVVHGATSARRSRGIAASRDSTTAGRRPISAISHHHTSPRAGSALTRRPPPAATRPGHPTRRAHQPDARRRRRSSRPPRLLDGERVRPRGCSSTRAASVIPARTLRALLSNSASTVVLRRMRLMPQLCHTSRAQYGGCTCASESDAWLMLLS